MIGCEFNSQPMIEIEVIIASDDSWHWPVGIKYSTEHIVHTNFKLIPGPQNCKFICLPLLPKLHIATTAMHSLTITRYS